MAEDRKKTSWQIPGWKQGENPAVFDWIQNHIDQGVAYQEANPGTAQLEQAVRILSNQPDEKLAAKQKDGKYSKLSTNRLKRNLREMCTSLSDVRFTPGYHSDANEFQDQATSLNRQAASWYVDRFIDRKIYKAVQWMGITPCGYLEICFRNIPGERNRKEIDVIPHSWFDVIQTGVNEGGDMQESYAVTIIKDPAVFLAHATWPDHQADLIVDGETPRGWRERLKDVLDNVFQDTPTRLTAKNPTVRMYYSYILDLSINKSGQTMKMGYEKPVNGSGEPTKTPWSYDVPSLGSMMLTGYDQNGTETFRRAEAKDCRIFPGRRLVVSTTKKVIYDGPMWDWHGKVPLVKFVADEWPFADYSMVHDVASIHDTIQELERIAHQTARNRFWPTLMYDMKAVARDKIKALRTDVSGQRIGYNPEQSKDPVKPLLSHDFYQVPDWFMAIVKYLSDEEDYQMGVRDISAMSKMRVGAASDSLEKLMELAGPIVKGISRNMERSMRDLAEMYKYLVLQYKTTPEIIQVVGVDGATPQNFDWDPGNLIPSHLPGERTEKPSVFNQMQRAHWIADHVRFFITPNTMHDIVTTANKMMYLQLMRAQFPVSWWRIAEVFNIPNFGKRPEGTNGMVDEWFKQQEMMLEFQAKLSVEAQGLMGGAPNGAGAGPGFGPKGGPKGTGGRAPSGQSQPRMAMKDGGSRSTIRESQ